MVLSPSLKVTVGAASARFERHPVAIRFSVPIQAGETRARVVADRTGDRARNLLVIGGAVLRGQFAAEGAAGATRGLVVNAAGRGAAVEHGRGTLEDVHRIECVKIQAHRVDRGGDRRGESVDVLLGRKAAHADEVEAQVGAVVLALHARGVAHGLLTVDEIEKIDLIARDDRDRLRRLYQRNVRLVRGLRADWNVAPRRHHDDLLAVLGASSRFRWECWFPRLPPPALSASCAPIPPAAAMAPARNASLMERLI